MVYKPKDSIILQIAIAAGLLVSIIFLLVIVGIDTKSVAERVIETRTEVNTRIKQSREIMRLREEAAIAEDKQKALGAILPKRDELFSFPNQIAKISTEKVVGTSFSFGNESDGQIAYNLAVQGSYTNIVEFVKTLERDIPFMDISSFNLNSSGDGGYSLDLRGSLFFNGEEG